MKRFGGQDQIHSTAPSWRSAAALGAFTLILAFLVFNFGGVRATDWNRAVVAIAAVSLASIFYRTGDGPPAPPLCKMVLCRWFCCRFTLFCKSYRCR